MSESQPQDELRPDIDPESGIDLSVIRENLKLTPWERILANDDTVNFCEMARAAVNEQRTAKGDPAHDRLV